MFASQKTDLEHTKNGDHIVTSMIGWVRGRQTSGEEGLPDSFVYYPSISFILFFSISFSCRRVPSSWVSCSMVSRWLVR